MLSSPKYKVGDVVHSGVSGYVDLIIDLDDYRYQLQNIANPWQSADWMASTEWVEFIVIDEFYALDLTQQVLNSIKEIQDEEE